MVNELIMGEVQRWLKSLGLERYFESFRDNEIEFDQLAKLTDNDLKELGVRALGHRKRLLEAAESLSVGTAEKDRSEVESGAEAVRTESEAERRQLTVMFADLVGSTALSRAMDPEQLRDITLHYQDIAKQAIESHGGFIARYMGDGILAYFGYPRAREDDPERAVRAALGLVEAMQQSDAWQASNLEAPLQVRVGIETGLVVVGDLIGEGASQESAVVGETANLAARLQGLASPDTIVIGPHLRHLLGDIVDATKLESQTVKGFDKALSVWTVNRIRSDVGRFERSVRSGLSRFVGRAAELELLRSQWSQVSSGAFSLVCVRGEAGIGKSRLVYEFMNGMPHGTSVLQGRCVSHGGSTAYLPFLDMLRRLIGVSDQTNRTEVVSALTALLARLKLSPELHLPYLQRLAGIPTPELANVGPDIVGIRTHESLLAVITAVAESAATVLFVNDLHWIDESSSSVLQSLATSRRVPQLMVLCTYRPSYEPPWPQSAVNSTIAVAPLSTSESTLLFQDVLRNLTVGSELMVDLFERCGGNPLYAEELARHVTYQLTGLTTSAYPANSANVPDSLAGLLLERVDSLGTNSRRLLQAAAVVGRNFSITLAADASGVNDAADAVAELERGDLVYPDGSREPGFYRFKHALIQDAVYESLLHTDRRRLHSAIAQSMRSSYSDRLQDVAEELARHYQLAEDGVEAARFAALAGQNAHGVFAIEAARRWYAQALDLMVDDNVDGVDELLYAETVVNQLEVCCFDADFETMGGLAQQSLPRIEKLGVAKEVSRTLSWLGEAHLIGSRFVESRRALQRALEIGESLQDYDCVSYALADLMWCQALAPVPEVSSVKSLSEELIELGISRQIPYLYVLSYYARALDATYAGDLLPAKENASRLIQYGEETGYPPARAWGHSIRSLVNTALEAWDEAVLDGTQAVRFASCEWDRIQGGSVLAAALAQREPNEAMRQIADLRPVLQKKGIVCFQSMTAVANGAAMARTGDADDALKDLANSIHYFSGLGNQRALAQLHLLRGELCLVLQRSVPEGVRSEPLRRINARSTEESLVDTGRAHLYEALLLAEASGMCGVIASSHLLLAGVALSRDDNMSARRHHEEAIGRCQTIDAPNLKARASACQRLLR